MRNGTINKGFTALLFPARHYKCYSVTEMCHCGVVLRHNEEDSILVQYLEVKTVLPFMGGR
jgi:hypothetical protein